MRSTILNALIASALMLALCGCSDSRPAEAAAAAPLSTTAASKPADSALFEASGPIVVENQLDVLAQRDGVVAHIAADTGARVSKGQLLAQLDDRQLQADKEAAEAKVASMEQNLKDFEAETRVLENDLNIAQQMYDAGLQTRQQLDHARYKLEGQRFQTRREAEIIRENRAMLRSLTLELEKTRILAPFDGVVARRYIREGQRVANNDRMFWVTATGPLSVKFTLPQEFAGKVAVADPVTVTAPASTAEYAARITRVSPVVDPASGSIEVQAQLTGAAAGLLPGMTASVRVRKAK
ncbi:MAG TPA: efflux RND transporter periplasmic adaptor subunit [Terriglobales bacterium]|nr:efflux RND transporter periplasmic adaptor subunit [Terriglobales bacterium]